MPNIFIVYFLMFFGFITYLLLLNFKVKKQKDNLEILKKMNLLKLICQDHQVNLFVITLISVMFGLFFIALGFKVLNFYESWDYFTATGWFVFVSWLCTAFGSLFVKDMVVKKGALYL